MKQTEMTGNAATVYVAPAIEVMCIQVENGFAESTSLKDLGEDDWWNGGFI